MTLEFGQMTSSNVFINNFKFLPLLVVALPLSLEHYNYQTVSPMISQT